MSCESLSLKDWDRTFLDLSSKMAEPFCAAWHLVRYRLVAPLDPQKFENCSTRTQEVATRVLIGLGAALGGYLLCAAPALMLGSVVVLGAASRVFRAMGFALQKDGFTHVCGTAAEKSLDPQNQALKVMTWNICGIGGGLSLDHGGVIHWRSRLDAIVEKIKTEDPDVLVLQEIYDTALAEALIKKFQTTYAHFFTHLGPNYLGSVDGCMVLSKCAVHDFSHTSFTNNDWSLNRGFATLELKATPEAVQPCARIIGTHLIHGEEAVDKTKRMVQVAQIVSHLAKKVVALPTLLMGDLNMERDQDEGTFLSAYLHHGYLGSDPTCTNRLTAQWDLKSKTVLDETIDYISLFKRPAVDANVTLENCHLVQAYDATLNTRTALSDHRGLSAIMKISKQRKL